MIPSFTFSLIPSPGRLAPKSDPPRQTRKRASPSGHGPKSSRCLFPKSPHLLPDVPRLAISHPIINAAVTLSPISNSNPSPPPRASTGGGRQGADTFSESKAKRGGDRMVEASASFMVPGIEPSASPLSGRLSPRARSIGSPLPSLVFADHG